MRKYIFILIISFILCLCISLIIYIFKVEHSVNYDKLIDNTRYSIEEYYNYDHGKHEYSFVIEDNKKRVYNFKYNNNLRKKKKIIDTIKLYKSNDLYCVVPIYINNNYGNVYCNKDGNSYSYSYLNSIDDSDFNKIKKQIKKDNYLSKKLDINSNKKTKKDKVYFYLKNIPDNYKFIMWNYTGIDIIDKNKVDTLLLIKQNDLYENPYSTMVNKYYMFLKPSKSKKIHYYSILNDKEYSIKNKNYTFSGSYIILGSYNNKLYFIDTDNYIEYSFNPKKNKLEKIGDERTGYITVKDRKEIKVETADLKNETDKYKIVSKVSDKKISNMFNTKDIYYYNDNYYYKSEDKFYRSNNKYKNKPILLFELDNVKDWQIYNNDILITTDSELYLYNDNYGLRRIVENDEFKYNYKNICLLYNGN